MDVGAGLYVCDAVAKSSRSLFHLLMSSCIKHLHYKLQRNKTMKTN